MVDGPRRLTPKAAQNLRRAQELDDNQPDNVCPGCGANIDGWQRFRKHYHGGGFTNTTQANRLDRELCVWTDDALAAREFRRYLLREAGMLPPTPARPS